MQEEKNIGEVTKRVAETSDEFEKQNTELKRKFLIWNIDAFVTIASFVSVAKGQFGTGYPFYALNTKLEGELPVIKEQIRYNRKLVKEGKPYQKSIWRCESCLKRNYNNMPDLKQICKPCPNMFDKLKPRKIINRLPDLDMWLVCEDGQVAVAEKEMSILLERYGIQTSDVDPIKAIQNVEKITDCLTKGVVPREFLPIDTHIIEYSALKRLIEQVPTELELAKKNDRVPYLPIHPKSYRKTWQYDDEAYNFIYDYLSAFTCYNFPEDLERSLNISRKIVATNNTPKELYDLLLKSSNKAMYRRYYTRELEGYFLEKADEWQNIQMVQEDSNVRRKIDDDELSI